jgi:fucose permease
VCLFYRDERSITICFVGAMIGESVIPALTGVIMDKFGNGYLLGCVLVSVVVLIGLYTTLFVLLRRDIMNQCVKTEKDVMTTIETNDQAITSILHIAV